MTERFKTLEDFLKKYSINEISILVCAVPPDEEGPYWLLQLALPMKNKCIDCEIESAKESDVAKLKKQSLSVIKRTLGVKDEVV